MTGLRRYTPLKPSIGTTWPPRVREVITERDGGRCVGERAGFPVVCVGKPTDIDHVRASHAMGKKSESTVANGALLDNWCHRWKTEHGREARPLLLAWIEAHPRPEPDDSCGHVDPSPNCDGPCQRRTALGAAADGLVDRHSLHEHYEPVRRMTPIVRLTLAWLSNSLLVPESYVLLALPLGLVLLLCFVVAVVMLGLGAQ